MSVRGDLEKWHGVFFSPDEWRTETKTVRLTGSGRSGILLFQAGATIAAMYWELAHLGIAIPRNTIAVISPTAEVPPDLVKLEIGNAIRAAIESCTRMRVEVYDGPDELPAIYASDIFGGWTKIADSVEEFMPEAEGGTWRRPLFASNEFRQNGTDNSITVHKLGPVSTVIDYSSAKGTVIAQCERLPGAIRIWKHRIACVLPWASLPAEAVLCQLITEIGAAFRAANKRLIIEHAV